MSICVDSIVEVVYVEAPNRIVRSLAVEAADAALPVVVIDNHCDQSSETSLVEMLTTLVIRTTTETMDDAE